MSDQLPCDSAYTIDRRTGEKLVCERYIGHPHGHWAEYAGLSWRWTDREADK